MMDQRIHMPRRIEECCLFDPRGHLEDGIDVLKRCVDLRAELGP